MRIVLLLSICIFLLVILVMPVNAVLNPQYTVCDPCHPSYAAAIRASEHAGSDFCLICHKGSYDKSDHTIFGYIGFIVNENTCNQPLCHLATSTIGRPVSESHGILFGDGADCTQCHMANTTQQFPKEVNDTLYIHDHNFTVEYNFFEYNNSGIPLSTNDGIGKGMFPYYTCTLTCHETDHSVEDEVIGWNESAHADSRRGPDSKNSCARCKSPPNYDAGAAGDPAIAEEDWQGIQCRVCHNLHNNSFSGGFDSTGFPLAFYNSTLSPVDGTPVYEMVSNATELCEKCHQPIGGSHDSKFAGYHKDTLDYTCVDCHANSTFSNLTHRFHVEDTTTGVEGCEVCHDIADHTWVFTDLHIDKMDCWACHDQTFVVNDSGFAVTEDGSFGLYKDPDTDTWTTYKFFHGSASTWPLHNISKQVNCNKCHGAQSAISGTIATKFAEGDPGNYTGNSSNCRPCHPNQYAKWANTTHTSKLLTRDDAMARGLPEPPGGVSWDNVSFVIGTKWKIRYVNDTGYIITAGGNNQYNVADQEWVDYHKDEVRPYDCGYCHTTGYLRNVSVNNMEPWRTLRNQGQYPDGVFDNSSAPGFQGFWAENSIGCEACHGQGGTHVNNPNKFNIINASVVRNSPDICGDCHSREADTHLLKAGEVDLIATLNDSSPSPLNATDGIDGQHHEQWEDWYDSKHRLVEVGCASCHGGHNMSDPAYAGGPTGKTKFINGSVFPAAVEVTCTDCHGSEHASVGLYDTNEACLECHMPKARSSVKPFDIRSHWFSYLASQNNARGEPHGVNFNTMKNITSANGAKISCEKCHGEGIDPNIDYSTVYRESKHNNSSNLGAPYCTNCHQTGYISEVVNETTSCRNSGCHELIDEAHNKFSGADCTQCHYANTTKPFGMNKDLYINSHELVVEYNFFNYNLSGMPLSTNNGTGVGMFPYYSCSLPCHGTGGFSVEDEAIGWNESAHAQSLAFPEANDNRNNCAKCKSPPNYNDSLNATNPDIAEEDWQGIQCRVCHNLHNDTYDDKYIAFYNSTLSNESSPVYEQVDNYTELCEKCHQPINDRHDSKFAGYHKDILGYTCTNCHANSTYSNLTHTFHVKDTTSGVEGCEVCHEYPGTAHLLIADLHENVECWACHDKTVSRNETDFVVTGDGRFGIYNDPDTGKWTTYKFFSGEATTWPLHNISREVSCDKCHGAFSVESGSIARDFRNQTIGPLASGYNIIALTIRPDPEIFARDLLYTSPGGIPGVTKVLRWNSTAQGWEGFEYIVADDIYLGTNFTMNGFIGFIKGNESTAGQKYTFKG